MSGRKEPGHYFVHNEENSRKLSTQAGSPQNQKNCMNHCLPAAPTTERWFWSKASAACCAWHSRKRGSENHTRRLLFSHTAAGNVSVFKDACEILLVLVTATHNSLQFSRVTSKGWSSQLAVSHWLLHQLQTGWGQVSSARIGWVRCPRELWRLAAKHTPKLHWRRLPPPPENSHSHKEPLGVFHLIYNIQAMRTCFQVSFLLRYLDAVQGSP